jgi:hypothetical protein
MEKLPMPAKSLILSLVLGLMAPATLTAAPQGNPHPSIHEFPVILQHEVVAGKTAVGTKITARLTMGTLIEKTVVPKNAIFNGEVVESLAKSGGTPSRLVIRTDSVGWKDGSLPVTAYLVSWYYPSVAESGQNLQYGPQQSEKDTWNGSGEYPGANTKAYRPFPDGSSDKKSAVPDTPNSITSGHRVPIKNVDLEVHKNGQLALISAHSNIKLDHLTTYVFLSGDLSSAK